MTPEQTELAKRLVSHPRWEWRAGVLTSHDWDLELRVISSLDPCVMDGYLPALDDWATVGVLLGMLESASEWLRFEKDDDGYWLAGLTSVKNIGGRGMSVGEVVALALLEVWE